MVSSAFSLALFSCFMIFSLVCNPFESSSSVSSSTSKSQIVVISSSVNPVLFIIALIITDSDTSVTTNLYSSPFNSILTFALSFLTSTSISVSPSSSMSSSSSSSSISSTPFPSRLILASEARSSASRMSLLGKGVEDIEDDLDDETEDETEDELDDEDIEDEGETEIEVEVKNDNAKVKIELNGEEYRFVVTDVSESVIINAIMNKTGLTEDAITTIWDFDVEDETEDDDTNGLQTSEKIMKHENKAKENAEETILQLQQKIDQLEERLQNLLDKFETGEYF